MDRRSAVPDINDAFEKVSISDEPSDKILEGPRKDSQKEDKQKSRAASSKASCMSNHQRYPFQNSETDIYLIAEEVDGSAIDTTSDEASTRVTIGASLLARPEDIPEPLRVVKKKPAVHGLNRSNGAGPSSSRRRSQAVTTPPKTSYARKLREGTQTHSLGGGLVDGVDKYLRDGQTSAECMASMRLRRDEESRPPSRDEPVQARFGYGADVATHPAPFESGESQASVWSRPDYSSPDDPNSHPSSAHRVELESSPGGPEQAAEQYRALGWNPFAPDTPAVPDTPSAVVTASVLDTPPARLEDTISRTPGAEMSLGQDKPANRLSKFAKIGRQLKSKSMSAFSFNSLARGTKRKSQAFEEITQAPDEIRAVKKRSLIHPALRHGAASNQQASRDVNMEMNSLGGIVGLQNQTNELRAFSFGTALPSGQSLDPSERYRGPSPESSPTEESRHFNFDAMAALEGRTQMISQVDVTSKDFKDFQRGYKHATLFTALEREEMMQPAAESNRMQEFTFRSPQQQTFGNGVSSTGQEDSEDDRRRKRAKTMPAVPIMKRPRPYSKRDLPYAKGAGFPAPPSLEDRSFDAMDVEYEVEWGQSRRAVSSFVEWAEPNAGDEEL